MRLLLFISTILFIYSCSGEKNAPDVSHIKCDVPIHRFDRDFFSIDTLNLERSVDAVQAKYPAFLPLYFEYFSPIDFIVRQQGKTYDEALREYIHNIKPLYDSANKLFDNTKQIKKGLDENLRYVKHYFPNFKMPVVLTSVESLNPENPMEIYGTTYYHDTLIISLQMFLGKNFSVYDPAQYPDYIRRRFVQEFIVPNCLRTIANDLYSDNSETGVLVDQMIEKGKQWYLLSKFLPNTPDSLITGYTSNQMEWCKKNEGNIWGYINQNENLFTTEMPTIQTYIGEAPFTSTLPHGNNGEGAPGNIGAWIGWRIVESYVANSGAKLQDMLKTPSRKIFQDSKYKPK